LIFYLQNSNLFNGQSTYITTANLKLMIQILSDTVTKYIHCLVCSKHLCVQ